MFHKIQTNGDAHGIGPLARAKAKEFIYDDTTSRIVQIDGVAHNERTSWHYDCKTWTKLGTSAKLSDFGVTPVTPELSKDELLEEARRRFPAGCTYKTTDGGTYINLTPSQPYWWNKVGIALEEGCGLVYKNGLWGELVKVVEQVKAVEATTPTPVVTKGTLKKGDKVKLVREGTDAEWSGIGKISFEIGSVMTVTNPNGSNHEGVVLNDLYTYPTCIMELVSSASDTVTDTPSDTPTTSGMLLYAETHYPPGTIYISPFSGDKRVVRKGNPTYRLNSDGDVEVSIENGNYAFLYSDKKWGKIINPPTSKAPKPTKETNLEKARRLYTVGTRFRPCHVKDDGESYCIIVNQNFTQEDDVITALTNKGRNYTSSDDPIHGNTILNRVVCANGVWSQILPSEDAKPVSEYIGKRVVIFPDYENSIRKGEGVIVEVDSKCDIFTVDLDTGHQCMPYSPFHKTPQCEFVTVKEVKSAPATIHSPEPQKTEDMSTVTPSGKYTMYRVVENVGGISGVKIGDIVGFDSDNKVASVNGMSKQSISSYVIPHYWECLSAKTSDSPQLQSVVPPTGRKFKVGDHIIGNEKASSRYNCTIKGWKGIVVDVNKDNTVKVQEADDGGIYNSLEEECFDLDIPVPTRPSTYTDTIVSGVGYDTVLVGTGGRQSTEGQLTKPDLSSKRGELVIKKPDGSTYGSYWGNFPSEGWRHASPDEVRLYDQGYRNINDAITGKKTSVAPKSYGFQKGDYVFSRAYGPCIIVDFHSSGNRVVLQTYTDSRYHCDIDDCEPGTKDAFEKERTAYMRDASIKVASAGTYGSKPSSINYSDVETFPIIDLDDSIPIVHSTIKDARLVQID